MTLKQRRRLVECRRLKCNLIAEQIERQGFAMCKCGKSFTEESAMMFLELHHKQFRSQGGKDTEDNVELLCGTCHGRKHGQVR